MPNGFEVERIINSGDVQELVCQTITLPAPAEEIKDVRKTVIVDRCAVVFDKVIVDGRLRKDILFKSAAAGFPIPGNVQGCTGTVNTVTGTLLDLDLEIAFNAMISVPGARPGDRCVVLQAFVEGQVEEPANIQANGTFTALIEKSIIFLCVKVVREAVMNQVGAAAGGAAAQTQEICPPRRSTGFFPSGEIPPPRPGLIPGSFIGPTLIFPGVINPGIPTTVPVANTLTSTQSTQVQISPAGGTTTTTTTTANVTGTVI